MGTLCVLTTSGNPRVYLVTTSLTTTISPVRRFRYVFMSVEKILIEINPVSFTYQCYSLTSLFIYTSVRLNIMSYVCINTSCVLFFYEQ